MRTLVVSKGARMGRAGDPAEAFRVLAATLRMRASLATTTMYAGGISVGDKDANRGAADNVPPFARKDLHTPFRFGVGVEAMEREP